MNFVRHVTDFEGERRHLIDVVQLGARAAAVVRLLPEPLGANLDPAAAGLAATGPVGPLAQLAV